MTDQHNQATGRDNVERWLKSVRTPPQYMPKVDEPPMGYFEDFCNFVRETWRPVLLCMMILALVCVLALLLTFQPLGN